MDGKKTKFAESDNAAQFKSQTERRQTVQAGHDYIACIHNDSDKKEYTIEILQASTQKHITLLKGHTDLIACVAFNATGSQVLSGSYDTTLRLWDVQSGQCLKVKVIEGFNAKGFFQSFSSFTIPEQLLPSGLSPLHSSTAVTKSLVVPQNAANQTAVAAGAVAAGAAVVFSNPPAAGAGAGLATNVSPFDVKGGFNSEKANQKITTEIWRTAQSGYDYVACTHEECDKGKYFIEILQASTQQHINLLKGHTNSIHCVAFNATGSQVLSGSADNTLRLWDVQSGQCLRNFEGHTGYVWCVAFDVTGSQVLSGGHDKTLRLWDVQSGQYIKSFVGHTSDVFYVAFNATGSQVLSGSYDNTLRLWDVQSGQCLRNFAGHTNTVSCVAFNATGSQVLSGSYDTTLRLWDVQSGRCLRNFEGHTASVTCVAFNASGSQVLSGSYDKTLRLWDVQSGQCLRSFAGHTYSVSCVAFNATGSQMLSGSWDRTLRLWDVQSGQCIKVIQGFKTKGTFESFSPFTIPEQLLPSGLSPYLGQTSQSVVVSAHAVAAPAAAMVSRPTAAASPHLPLNPSLEDRIRKMQVLNKQTKWEESLKNAGMSVGDGNVTQVLASSHAPNKTANTDMLSQFERQQQANEEQLRQLTLQANIARETMLTGENMTVFVEATVKQAKKK